ncbi:MULTISPECIES: hypothetical protein [Diaphorobacter]|uniref:Uncharacterized protein n=1 Tax=Diaphorobacter nitroreducens TaxID=164759 RepID=A0AAX1WTH9_9BURK|nr:MULTISPECIES: hypothetical protein [Diaphorobacter]TFI47620.1 hypothetical protein E4O93_11665 [Diaphorobacter sp. DS2]ASI68277.1 hypothetical protein BA022_06635 [Diaphorobacter nitroreducens]QPN32067.1 hypothetical protein I3K84_05465 [Diaphorobacter sp. JS3051]ROR41452.1 hypothetical protein EDC60_2735 [Diaphorobacter nitroreducens]WKK90275.1 hypothetical protein QY917_03735 [Diaphorobacter sp. C33]
MARTPATDTAAPAAQAPAPAPAKDLATEAPAASPKRSPAKPSKAHVKAPLKAATKAAPSVADKEKDMKAKKPKLVRDSFTIPKDEYAVIETLKERTARLSTPAKKSELLRAGLKVLSQLDDATLQKAMQSIPAIKTGRPKSDKK